MLLISPVVNLTVDERQRADDANARQKEDEQRMAEEDATARENDEEQPEKEDDNDGEPPVPSPSQVN